MPSDSYKVGFGKPPKHSQFKPGRSGNPKGRPSGSKNALTVLRAELEELIPMEVNGMKKWITVVEGMAKRAKVEALKGRFKPLRDFVEIAEKLAALDVTPPVETEYEVTLVFDEEEERARARTLQ